MVDLTCLGLQGTARAFETSRDIKADKHSEVFHNFWEVKICFSMGNAFCEDGKVYLTLVASCQESFFS